MLYINLEHKTAIVTGASGQIGRTLARVLASCGCDVAVHYHSSEKKALEVCEEIRAMGRRALPVQARLESTDSVMEMKERVKEGLGMPQIVVSNAVAQYEWKTVLEQGVEDYIGQFETCVLQNVNLAKAFVPDMIEKRYGRIVGMNTQCAMQLLPCQSAYASAKRGMDGILKVLAREVAEYGITVNQVAPGYTITDKDRRLPDRKDADYIKTVPMKRRGTDEEVAHAVAFLASDLAAFITGVYIPVSGGTVMPCI